MKFNRNLLLAFVILIISTALYRVIPYEMRAGWLGAPQYAAAVFAGAVIPSRKWAFAAPIFSMLFSDVLMQLLHWYNPSYMAGFYSGQFLNYVLIASLTVIGFFVGKRNIKEIFGGLLAAPTVFFLLSNFVVWAGNGGWHRSKTAAGLMQAYADGLPFYKSDLVGTLVWGTVFFGLYYLVTSKQNEQKPAFAKA